MKKDQLLKTIKRSLFFLPDTQYLKLYYRLRLGKKLDLHNPVTLNEKLQWLKLNYRMPLQTVVADKLLVRDYVRDRIGGEYLVPLLGNWEHFDDIDFSALPDQFVLKCNHDSGGLVICKNKAELDIPSAKKNIEKSLRSNFYPVGREYQYKNIHPRILCEQFLSDNGNVPADYKIYCFNGEPDCILVCVDRFSQGSNKAKYYFYDKKWSFLRYNIGDDQIDDPHLPQPQGLEKMLEIAKILSSDFIFARIDLYNLNGKIYFGEITLSPNSGFDPDITAETDYLFGQKLNIPYWDQLKK